jgi:hypothetical protein
VTVKGPRLRKDAVPVALIVLGLGPIYLLGLLVEFVFKLELIVYEQH